MYGPKSEGAQLPLSKMWVGLGPLCPPVSPPMLVLVGSSHAISCMTVLVNVHVHVNTVVVLRFLGMFHVSVCVVILYEAANCDAN